MGTSHFHPVMRLHIPAQNNAGPKEILRERANAVVRGMKVPRSPREPESSEIVRVCISSLRRRLGLQYRFQLEGC